MGEVTFSGPEVLEMIGRKSLSSLDGHNAGRYMPPRLEGVGTGSQRRFTVREAAVTWACTEFGGEGGKAGEPAVGIARHLHRVNPLPAYAGWTARGRLVFTDDPAEVVRVCTEHGGGRVLRLGYYLARVRRFSKSSDGAGVELPSPGAASSPALAPSVPA